MLETWFPDHGIVERWQNLYEVDHRVRKLGDLG